jgi:hypothetical protein
VKRGTDVAKRALPCRGGGKRRDDVAAVFQANRSLPQPARSVGRCESLVSGARHAECEDACDAPHIEAAAARHLILHCRDVARKAPGCDDRKRATEAVADKENAFGSILECGDQRGPDAFDAAGVTST